MKKTLTAAQKRVIAVIQDLSRKMGHSPTLEELRVALKLASTSSVQRHIEALRKKGVITGEKHQARNIELNIELEQTVNIPVVGNVACGVPILAVQNIVAYIPYKKSLLHGRSADDYFFLKAVGDSMNASSPIINDGDYVLVKKQSVAVPGQRVVALIGDEATIKKFKKANNHYILEPESTNSTNKPIYVFADLFIQGIVQDVIKKGGE